MLQFLPKYASHPTSNPCGSLSTGQERKLRAFPMVEVCGPDVINYMAPLSRQTDFLVPEMVEEEEVATDVKEDDSEEDRGTDITGQCPMWWS